MNEGTASRSMVDERLARSCSGRINLASTMLRIAGLVGAAYCAIQIVALVCSWLELELGVDGTYPFFGPRIIGFGLPLIAFLFAYATGAALPVLVGLAADKR